MERAASASKSPHLSVITNPRDTNAQRLTRAQVADRLGASISTVRRLEGVRLHPQGDEDGVHWFDPKEVSALAAERANDSGTRRRNASATTPKVVDERTAGEIAALVFERLEQRQSLAEIVVGLRITPDVVRGLFDQWTLGLTDGQLRMAREPTVSRDNDTPRTSLSTLATRLAALPEGQTTRVSVARYRGPFQHGDREYADVQELGGFLVSGPCGCDEIIQRFGRGDYRVTAYGFDPPGVRWELIVDDVGVG